MTDVPMLIREKQISSVRMAFDAASITDHTECKEIIKCYLARPVASLRDLYASEVRYIIAKIETRPATRSQISGGSVKDNRDKETWIDKL